MQLVRHEALVAYRSITTIRILNNILINAKDYMYQNAGFMHTGPAIAKTMQVRDTAMGFMVPGTGMDERCSTM